MKLSFFQFAHTSVYFVSVQFSSVAQLCPTLCNPMNHRPPCPSPTPGVDSNSCPSSRWCHPAISFSVVPFSSCPQPLPAWVFSNESTLRMRWPKYWSFSFSVIPSKEHPRLISFRMDFRQGLFPKTQFRASFQLSIRQMTPRLQWAVAISDLLSCSLYHKVSPLCLHAA